MVIVALSALFGGLLGLITTAVHVRAGLTTFAIQASFAPTQPRTGFFSAEGGPSLAAPCYSLGFRVRDGSATPSVLLGWRYETTGAAR